MSKVAVIVPTRKGRQRVSKKNTKFFAGLEGGLLKIKLGQLSNVVIIERPEHLCLETTLSLLQKFRIKLSEATSIQLKLS